MGHHPKGLQPGVGSHGFWELARTGGGRERRGGAGGESEGMLGTPSEVAKRVPGTALPPTVPGAHG